MLPAQNNPRRAAGQAMHVVNQNALSQSHVGFKIVKKSFECVLLLFSARMLDCCCCVLHTLVCRLTHTA